VVSGEIEKQSEASYSSVKGVIFFSSISSSANSFLYFSQLFPVADGMANGGSRCAREYVQKVAEDRKAQEYDVRQKQETENEQNPVADSGTGNGVEGLDY